MFYHILEKYVADPRGGMPLAVDVDIPGDYHLFLLESLGQWYVVIEADYFRIDIETAGYVEWLFPVSVQGWCVIKEYQKALGKDVVPVDWFFNEDGTEVDGMSYDHATFQERGRKYALLKVIPDEGVSARSFGLAFFAGSEKRPIEDEFPMRTSVL